MEPPRARLVYNLNELEIGDVIVYDYDGNNIWNHAAIVTRQGGPSQWNGNKDSNVGRGVPSKANDWVYHPNPSVLTVVGRGGVQCTTGRNPDGTCICSEINEDGTCKTEGWKCLSGTPPNEKHPLGFSYDSREIIGWNNVTGVAGVKINY
jgi:hypothetical protein